MLVVLLLGTNVLLLCSCGALYLLYESLLDLQRENLRLQQQLMQQVVDESIPLNPSAVYGLLGTLTLVVCGVGVLVLLSLRNDSTVTAELTKVSMRNTGDYVKEVVVPSVDLLTKASESRLVANMDTVKVVVTEASAVVTNHVTEVSKEGVLCIINTMKPQILPRTLGKLSTGLLNLMP